MLSIYYVGIVIVLENMEYVAPLTLIWFSVSLIILVIDWFFDVFLLSSAFKNQHLRDDKNAPFVINISKIVRRKP